MSPVPELSGECSLIFTDIEGNRVKVYFSTLEHFSLFINKQVVYNDRSGEHLLSLREYNSPAGQMRRDAALAGLKH